VASVGCLFPLAAGAQPVSVPSAARPARVVVAPPTAASVEACPPAGLVRALRTRLGDVAVVESSVLGGADLGVSLVRMAAGSGVGHELRVERPDGGRALTRPLASEGMRCGEIDEAAALILERYFVDVEWSGRRAPLGMLTTPGSLTTPGLAADAPAPSNAPFLRSIGLSPGFAGVFESVGAPIPALTLAMSVELGRRACLSAAVAASGVMRESFAFVVDRTVVSPSPTDFLSGSLETGA